MTPKPEKVKSLKRARYVLKEALSPTVPLSTSEIFTNINMSQGTEEMAQWLRACIGDDG